MQQEKFGIYLNTKELKVVRINSPYWTPSGEEWVFLTPEVNATLVKIRELIQQRNITNHPDKVTWGSIPDFMK